MHCTLVLYRLFEISPPPMPVHFTSKQDTSKYTQLSTTYSQPTYNLPTSHPQATHKCSDGSRTTQREVAHPSPYMRVPSHGLNPACRVPTHTVPGRYLELLGPTRGVTGQPYSPNETTHPSGPTTTVTAFLTSTMPQPLSEYTRGLVDSQLSWRHVDF
jgi:hypothetical protein